MHKTAYLGFVSLIGLGLAGACSRQSSEDGSAGSGNQGTVPINPIRNAGGTGSGTTPPTLGADSNGLAAIPADQKDQIVAQACNGWAAEPELAPSALVFVVDVSGTMNSATAATGTQTKYQVTRDALRTATGDLPANLEVGLTFFPNMDNGGAVAADVQHDVCINTANNVAPAPLGNAGSAQRTAIDQQLMAVTPEPNGATPTHDAFNLARDLLLGMPAGVSKYVAILTDGEPTLREGCIGKAAPRNPEPTQPIIDAIASAYNTSEIKTFIIGSPGSEKSNGSGADVRGWLSQAAQSGGTAPAGCSNSGPNFCHMDMTQATNFGAALADGLAKIAGQVAVSCLYDVPPAPAGETIDPALTNLFYTDGNGNVYAILQNGAANCDKGWHFINGNAQIEICGQTCGQIMADKTASLDLMFGCAQVVTTILQ